MNQTNNNQDQLEIESTTGEENIIPPFSSQLPPPNNDIELRQLDASARNDKQRVLAAIAKRGIAFYYASDELKADWDVAAAAIRQDPFT